MLSASMKRAFSDTCSMFCEIFPCIILLFKVLSLPFIPAEVFQFLACVQGLEDHFVTRKLQYFGKIVDSVKNIIRSLLHQHFASYFEERSFITRSHVT